MISIKDDEFTHNLKIKYEIFKEHSKNSEEEELLYIRGYCRALEQIAIVFGDFTEEQIADIKRPIIGNISMRQEKKVDLDQPTYLRQENQYD